MIVGGGRGQGSMDGAATKVALSGGFGVGTAFELELDVASLGEVRDCVHEGKRFKVHDEFYGVPAFIAAETVVEVSLCMYRKRRGLLGVVWVWAETDEAGSLAPEGGELGGDLDDVRRLPYLLYAPL